MDENVYNPECKHFNQVLGQCLHNDNKFKSCRINNCPKQLIRMRAFDYHWAEAILKEHKHIEVGSQITKPGIMAIYAKKKEQTRKNKEKVIKHFSTLNHNGFITREMFEELRESVLRPEYLGYVLGTVEVAYVRKNISELQFHGSIGMHLAPDEYYKRGHTHFWVLKNPIKFDKPVKIEKWNSGGPWAKIDKSLLEGNMNEM